jgi:hypothetical protein
MAAILAPDPNVSMAMAIDRFFRALLQLTVAAPKARLPLTS